MKPINKELLSRYINGKCSSEEEKQVHQWLDDNDESGYPYVHSIKKYNRKISKGWSELANHFEELHIEKARTRLISWTSAAMVAAFILLLITGAYFTGNIPFLHSYKREFQTSYGEVKRINLDDGTIVTLNSKSTLKIDKYYDKKNRNVYLNGEAFFDVKGKTGIPFIVHTRSLSVTALGTAFNVSAFRNDPNTSVLLKEGKVLVKASVKKSIDDVVLIPGEGLIYKRDKEIVQTEKFDAKVELAWQKQIIAFKDANMHDVVRKLARFYGVNIDISQLKPRHWQLTGEYKNQTLRDVLESLSFNYNLRYKIDGKQIILYDP